ncbi:hypothetical protein [Couchioplanes azureus]|uniref:hypothetical protein n=1 Tax=Couchioplanes caeruleus TaxID=56438 RepID=UPI001670DCC3|nr:hypothetical protein [Couchioplanes caeruleus]GGQ77608.1 hypothetical protein GCM10010166_54450 [Couchioplanes caeruleus subsp. azureus]
MNLKPLALIAAAVVLVLPVLSGCRAQPGSSGATGVVIDHHRWKCSVRNVDKCRRHSITIRETSGKTDKGWVSREVFDACQIGDPWPACKP